MAKCGGGGFVLNVTELLVVGFVIFIVLKLYSDQQQGV